MMYGIYGVRLLVEIVGWCVVIPVACWFACEYAALGLSGKRDFVRYWRVAFYVNHWVPDSFTTFSHERFKCVVGRFFWKVAPAEEVRDGK